MTRFDQSPRLLDSAEILHSIGDVAYDWQLDSDVLSWSGNAAAVLGVALSESGSPRLSGLGTVKASLLRRPRRAD